MELVKTRPRFDPNRGTVKTWAFTLARGILRHFSREEKRIPAVGGAAGFFSQLVGLGLISRPAKIEFDQFLETIRQLLSGKEKAVFDLWLAGYDTSEIAEELKVTEQNVYETKHRITKKLVKHFGIDGPLPWET